MVICEISQLFIIHTSTIIGFPAGYKYLYSLNIIKMLSVSDAVDLEVINPIESHNASATASSKYMKNMPLFKNYTCDNLQLASV